MGNLGLPELLVILVVVLLVFGPGRLSKVAGELGKGIRSFKEGMSGADEPSDPSAAAEKEDQNLKV